ncbi:alkylated DNA repair protein alkB homolog 8-like [Olea europaea var. sylvestris]|uniref:alkylated DNA repair protein alkB homolog 8-like n=1 Tax=Olea europaea var. sylvestris TaxID=158386 RepID=UPI000C1CECA4|nr:alkylated DNA repair protein alkB homolog 8-like [Olea europaea var. sylvestris]XP_022863177.1 alkylated DNA repair protein alkB homolog 8-like [Olea europaea var. sylvestris]XP_022863178.1 alkylated DNA repair protein alkB homolog 8-like [Olea europaea var. sylvestris]XP_022863179.1 alkylated DNA repair protein alkB homolog 8-like [Olea europaea var. sylvestris]XP_022863181.1 alkylated DNA repair protein alkB homolog 8-like [Olea europaea var. sylvestris]XP_022863182.1 alkylated DNA repair
MGLPRFTRPKGGDGESSPNLYVANCGPAVGLSFETIMSVFGTYGEVKGVYAADESGTRVIVSYYEESSAQAALKELDGHPCANLGGRSLHIRYSAQSLGKVKVNDTIAVSTSASDLKVPGVYLVHDFVTAKEEEELLAAVDSQPWQHLAKRRVQHYGYEFRYDIRNVNTKQYLGDLPSFVSPVLGRIKMFQKFDSSVDVCVDQLTVNEYPPGVGLSPHIDTHSAFEGSIFSLSLAGPCIMEFRLYSKGVWLSTYTSSFDAEEQICENSSNFLRKAIYLPPRSMLLLSGEGRYAWHHYIPHHKVDKVKDSEIRRGPRRVSLTLRKVRKGPCQCEFPQYCDSQN